MELVDSLFAGIPLKELLFLFCGILLVGFIFKKLLKLAVAVIVVVVSVFVLIPMIQNLVLNP